MHYLPLPEKLKPGDLIACPAHYDPPSVYEVFKVDGERAFLINEAGVALHGNFTVQILRDFDYKLINMEVKSCPIL
jgi:hypothetical protein